jgi:hypothetical protein
MTAKEVLNQWDWSQKAEVIEAMKEFAEQEVKSNANALIKLVLDWRGIHGIDVSTLTLGEFQNLVESNAPIK